MRGHTAGRWLDNRSRESALRPASELMQHRFGLVETVGRSVHHRTVVWLLTSALIAGVVFGRAACSLPVFAAEGVSTDRDAAGGLRLRLARQAQPWLDAARQHVRQGQLADALRLLERLPTEAADRFVDQPTTSVSGSWGTESVWRSLSTEQRQLAEELIEATAEAEWQRVIQDGHEASLREFSRRFGGTRWGVLAAQHQLALLLDRQHWQQALAAGDRLLDHPASTATDRATVLVVQAMVLSRQQRPVPTWSPEQVALLQRTTVTLGGEAKLGWEWLSSLAAPVAADVTPSELTPRWRAVWQVPTTVPGPWQPVWDRWQQELRAQGALPWPAAQPLQTGSAVVVRTTTDLRSVSADSGQLLWRIPNDAWRVATNESSPVEMDGRRWMLIEQSGRRALSDTLTAGLASDGERVFAIQDAQSQGLPLGFNAVRNFEETREGPSPTNVLLALHRATGDLVWRAGGSSQLSVEGLAEEFFCGVPTFVDDLALVLSQRQTELQLHALRAATGSPLWSVTLGDVPRPLLADPLRQRTGCPVVLDRGLLLCPTASGALVAVDLLTRTPRWAYRYRVNLREQVYRPRGESTAYLPDCWWDAWRGVNLSSQRGTVVLASPESNELHAIDLTTGALRWKVPRKSGLAVLAQTDAFVIVAEGFAVRAHRLQDGQVTWRTTLTELAGRGAVLADRIWQPLADGRLAILDVATGSIQPGGGVYFGAMGNLSPTDTGWFVTHRDQLSFVPRHQTRAAWLAQTVQNAAANASDSAQAATSANPTEAPAPEPASKPPVAPARSDTRPSSAIKRSTPDPNGVMISEAAQARLDAALGELELGQTVAALAVLDAPAARETDRHPDEHRLRHLAWRAWLQQQPDRWTVIRDQLPTGPISDAEVVQTLQAVSRAAMETGDSRAAGELLLSAFSRVSTRVMVDGGTPRLRIRGDLALLGTWDDLFGALDGPHRTAAPEIRQLGTELLTAAWNQAVDSTDPFALQRMDDRWRALPVLDAHWPQHAHAVFLGRSLWDLELRSLQAIDRRLSTNSGLALETLERELTALGFADDAAAYRRRWGVASSTVTAPQPSAAPGDSATSGAAAHDAASPDGGDVANTSLLKPWPNAVVQIEQQRRRNDDVYQRTLPMDLEMSPWFNQLDVSVQRMGQFVRFAGAAHPFVWDLPLPASNSMFRPMFFYNQGWGRGRLLLLRCGAELFALAPCDDRGSPVARVLWMHDLTQGLMQREGLQDETVPGQLGLREEQRQHTDAFGRVLAQVGPVCHRYLCYHHQGKLVALETLTGQRLWERFDLPVSATTWGDEEFVLLWNPVENSLEVLRACDGRTLMRRTWNAQVDTVLARRDRRAWRIEADGNTRQLIAEDLVAGTVLWKQPLTAATIPTLLDANTALLIDSAAQTLHTISLNDGSRQQLSVSQPLPDPIERIAVMHDAERWYLGLSGKVEHAAALQQMQIHNSYRAPFLTGWLAAIDRRTQQCLWTRPAHQEAWSLDQPRSAPVLLQAYKLPAEEEQLNRPSDGVLKLVDKRTGQDVFALQQFNLNGYVSLEPDAERALIDVRLENESIRLRYRPAPPSPNLPEPVTAEPAPQPAR
jgi:outer membrane protein assembly factor BamB